MLPGKEKSVPIMRLWRVLSEEPAAVIQGTTGMSKSTLLLRLALPMARCTEGSHDDLSGQQLAPTLIPLFISPGPYATCRQKQACGDKRGRSLRAYLASQPDEMSELSKGRCLITSSNKESPLSVSRTPGPFPRPSEAAVRRNICRSPDSLLPGVCRSRGASKQRAGKGRPRICPGHRRPTGQLRSYETVL